MFHPTFQITPQMAKTLMHIETLKEGIENMPMSHRVLMYLRERAQLQSTYYSTMLEGNRLSQEEVELAIKKSKQFFGRKRDEKDVKGYYAAVEHMGLLAKKRSSIEEKDVQLLHALVMGGGSKTVKPTAYRDTRDAMQEGQSDKVIFLSSEPKDIPALMNDLIQWINESIVKDFPIPIVAGIAHYQFTAIHPYDEGNERTARLFTTLIMHLGGYGLKGLCSLEEYYTQNPAKYHQELDLGTTHNYYLGRAEANISKWTDYFIEGIASSFRRIKERAQKESEEQRLDSTELIDQLDIRKKQVLDLFKKLQTIASQDLEKPFKLKPRSARLLCQKWAEEDFIEAVDHSKKNRKYQLTPEYRKLLN